MSEALHQMNITYSSKEDRLLLRTSTQKGTEYRVWLTRRFSCLLLHVLDKELEKRGGVIHIGSQEETKQMLREGALKKPYESQAPDSYPLGEDGMLAYGIKSRDNSDGGVSLEIHSEAGLNLGFNLDDNLLFMFQNLITQGMQNAEWEIPRKKAEASSQKIALKNIH
ncbi:MAG: hypothetical protein ACYYK0_03820 [Candidatus Eutrophobiaceae bacterium]